MISVKGEVKPLSFDHKPTNESKDLHIYTNQCLTHISTAERARISGAGGYVEYGRVNGM